jgi:haloacetate dehalogenase
MKFIIKRFPGMVNLKAFDEFEATTVQTEETSIFLRRSGSGPGVLMLHGFPQTHLMWRHVAHLLARHYTVVCADLRGYGNSGCPASGVDHAPYSKRTMAAEMIAVMEKLGFSRFSVVGHDRGGRVAYRMALDHPERVRCLAVLDIVPTAEVWDRADKKFASAFWPWSLLMQPEPLPERLLLSAPDSVVDNALSSWGSRSTSFSREVREAYVKALSDYAHVHAICEEYRAAATLDYDHDLTDRLAGHRITCPLLVLWSKQGALDTWYTKAGGPLSLWKTWAEDVSGKSFNAGHFFPEEIPEQTADELNFFLNSRADF